MCRYVEKSWKELREFFLHYYDPFQCKKTEIVGLKYAKSMVLKNKKKRGVIFLCTFGNWEIGPYIINKLNTELMGIYRKSNNVYLDKLIQKYKNKTNYVPKGDLGAKESFLWLRKEKDCLLMDQNLMKEQILISQETSKTATAIAELAIRMNLDIIPIKLLRTNNNGHKVIFYKKISFNREKLSHNQKVRFILRKVNDHLSDWIKKNPEQWLWIHRRWKKELYNKK